MKTLIFIILLMLISLSLFAQTVPDADAFTISIIWDAFKEIISSANWQFIIVFMLTTWLINDTAEATNVGTWFNWLTKIPKIIRTLVIALLNIILFAWAFQIHGRIEIFYLIISTLLSMVAYKIGINRILRWASKKLGYKFDEQ